MNMKKAKSNLKKKKSVLTVKSSNKTLIVGGIVLILLIGLFSLAYYFGFGPTGKAYTFGKESVPQALYDLTKDPDMFITYLPVENKMVQVNLSLNKNLMDLVSENYTLQFLWIEEGVYQVRVGNDNSGWSRDIFEEGSQSDFHLNAYGDNESDLKVSLKNGQLILKNPHFISPGKTKIVLTELNGTIYPLVISSEMSQQFKFRLNASSVLTPKVNITIDGKSVQPDSSYYDNKSTILNFSWTAPSESKAVILKIISDVKGMITTSSYLITVGDAAYLLEEEGFPKFSMNFITKVNKTATLNLDFKDTTDLQPFAIPCNSAKAIDPKEIFNASIRKIYSYANDGEQELVEVWNPNSPSDIDSLVPKKGYFLELNEPLPYTVTINCTVPVLANLNQKLPPNLIGTSDYITIYPGWNLVSLPGILPISLDDLQEGPGLKLFQCAQGYQCSEIKEDRYLYPGKPYWIYAEEEQNLNFYYMK